MASHMFRLTQHMSPKSILLSKIRAEIVLKQSVNHIYGRTLIGNRDVVGFGMNGSYSYFDDVAWPAPAIRFREETPETTALRKKETEDWHKLSIDDKKKLYRHSFCRTYAEIIAPTGEWKSVLAGVLTCISVGLWMFILLKIYIYPPMPESTSPEWKQKQMEWMINWGVDRIGGLSSKWDYDNNRWKE